MECTTFDEATTQLLPPTGMEDEVYAIDIWRDDELQLVISHWHPTWRDRIRILFGRPIWLHVRGMTHPPLSIETDYPFDKDRES